MSRIEINHKFGRPDSQILIDGVDYSMDTYTPIEVVEVGEDEWACLGVQLVFAPSELVINGEPVDLKDIATAADLVRAIVEDAKVPL